MEMGPIILEGILLFSPYVRILVVMLSRTLNRILVLLMLIALLLWGLQKAASRGYFSEFDASPGDLNFSVHAETNVITIEWKLHGGSIVRSLAGGRDAVILVYPGEVEQDASWRDIVDIPNVSVVLGGRSVDAFEVLYYTHRLVVSNGSENTTIEVFAVPFDFPSTVQSGKIRLNLTTYDSCNNVTVDVIYFHSTGRGGYRNLVLPLSVGFGERFPILHGFRSEFNLTVTASKMPDFLSSAVNAHYLGNWIDKPHGWLIVKTVNVTVCPPKTS